MRLTIKISTGLVALALVVNVLGLGALSAATNWSIVPSPNPAGATNSQLEAVSCLSTTNCTAVGTTYSPGSGLTLIEHWDGATWGIVPSPNPAGAQYVQLQGVSCPAATFCAAVGTNGPGHPTTTLIEQWNGISWTVVPSPNPAGSDVNQLTAVSCISATRCTAVGFGTDPVTRNDGTLVETWDGTAWSIVPSPNVSRPGASLLLGVSCTSATDCMAAGTFSGGGTGDMTLTEHWDGTAWTIVPSPNPAVTNGADLFGISCSAASSCTAVGVSQQDPGDVTLVEQWDGTAWTIVPSPNAAGTSWLNGVSCPSATSCVATGYANTPGPNTPLIEQWDGSSWSIAATPTPPGPASLQAPSCVSATDCFAVGVSFATIGTALTKRSQAGSPPPTTTTTTSSTTTSSTTTSTTSTTVATTTTTAAATTTTTIAATTTCFVSGLRAGPPKQQDVTVQNTAGVAAITNIQIVNGTVRFPAFTAGTSAPIVVTATKNNQSQPTNWSFDVVSSQGVTTHCG